MRRWLLAGLGTAVLALLLWQWLLAEAWQDRANTPSQGTMGANVASAATLARGQNDLPAGPGSTPSTREQVAIHDGSAKEDEWTMQLLGIDPAVPWTAPLVLVFENRMQLSIAVDAQGTSRFVPPPFARLPGITNLLVIATDDHYILERAYHQTAPLQTTGRLELTVYQSSLVRGRVVGPGGTGIVARVSAFAWGENGPEDTLLARAESQPDGTYLLRVPPDVPLLLLGEALTDRSPLAWWSNQQSPMLLDFGKPVSLDEPREFDPREPRADLLPATLRAEAARLTTRTVADLVLTQAAPLTGRVTFADGRPLANVDVVAQPASTTTRPWHTNLHWSPTDGLHRGAQARTDERGAFTLQLPPGVPFLLTATTANPLLLAGEPSTVAGAPGFAELIAPGDLVTFQVLANGQPVPRATVHLDGHSWPTDNAGQLRATLGPQTTRARASAGVRTSAWIPLSPDVAAQQVQLELLDTEVAQVNILLRSKPGVLAAQFVWHSVPEGLEFSLHSERERDDAPFIVAVPPGSYRLTSRGSDAEPGSQMLLPSQTEITVPPAGIAIEQNVAFGGRIALDLREQNGMRPAGTFTLRDAAGHEVTPHTITYNGTGGVCIAEPGVLQQGNINHLATTLPPGEYSLSIDLRGGSHIERTVQVEVWATTSVKLRRP
jgi:hypothetical protein